MNCTSKIGHNFGRCSFSMQKYFKETKSQALLLFKIGFGIYLSKKMDEDQLRSSLFNYKMNLK